jgi:hypothetical protein
VRPTTHRGVDAVELIWTFARSAQRLELSRRPTPDGVLLFVKESGRANRSYFFNDVSALVHFQNEMEAFLIRTGWSFVAFSPERRRDGDRRSTPRSQAERRLADGDYT